MIPVRIAVKNFLTYATLEGAKPIVFDFDGAALWSVAGDNGAGKSALFDAITWTLFDQHRGGGQRDERLVRHGAAGCYAAFEFRIDQRIYKVERSLTVRAARPKTWQASVFDPEANDWRPIPDTSNKTGFERWVQEKLGLRHGTFIASTLLLQGQSDKLILAKPKERFDILAGLLDLARYQDLAQRAHEHASIASGAVKSLDARLDGVPAVDDTVLSSARDDAATRSTAFTAAQDRVEAAAVLITQAQAHAGLEQELRGMRIQLDRAAAAIADAERIRAEYEERGQLAAALPRVEDAIGQLTSAVIEDGLVSKAEAALSKIDLTALEEQATLAREAERSAEQVVTDAQTNLTDCDQTRVEVEREVGEVDTCERLETSVATEQKSIKALRVDLAGRADVDARLQTLEIRREAQPLAERLLGAQADLAAREAAVAKIGTLAHWTDSTTAAEGKLAAAEAAKAAAEATRTTAQNELSHAKAAERLAREALTERRGARGEAVCSRCGQKVDAAHAAQELARAERALKEATEAVTAANTGLTAVSAEVTKASDQVNALTKARDDARHERLRAETAEGEVSKARTAVTLASSAIATATAETARVVEELAVLTVAKRDALIRELKDLPALRTQAAELQSKGALLEDALGRVTTLEAELAPLRAALPPEERTRRRTRQRELAAERKRLERALELARTVYGKCKQTRERADTELANARTNSTDLRGQIDKLRERAQSFRSLAALRLKEVPELWRARAQAADATLVKEMKTRFNALGEAERRYAELVEAEQTHGQFATAITSIEERIGRIPAAQRIPVDTAQAEQRDALNARTAAEKERDAANKRVHELEQQRERRAELESELGTARRRAHLYGRLEELLGRRRLQAFLIDEALRGVQAYANETLGRVSDHQLELHLRRESTAGGDEEIVIRATDHSSADAPLDIEFISGGQKFRVAVALAAGIGQYAGGMRGAPRALIVDEGFGSLDVKGRQEMIEELHSLAQYLERVIVVSHHDDFRDRLLFPSRYMISRSGEATVVERLV